VDLVLCKSRNIEAVRRITGGGAIYMDAGVVTFDLLITAKDGMNTATLSAQMCSSIARELAAFGVSAEFRPDNDVVAGGKKLFGASGFADGSTLLYQGSLMVSPDVAIMGDVLKIPDLADRVTTVSDLAERPVTTEQMEGLLAQAIGNALGRPLESGALSSDEIKLQNQLLASDAGLASVAFPEQVAA
jgi:lipoate-protein ligase A